MEARNEIKPIMKYCKRCATYKVITAFYRNKVNNDGRTAICKKCFDKMKRKTKKDEANVAPKIKASGNKGVYMNHKPLDRSGVTIFDLPNEYWRNTQ